MPTTGIDHVGFTVTDLDRTTQWYCEHLGFEPLLRYTNDAIGAEVQILRHPDHFALGVADDAELAGWRHRLETGGIECSRTDLGALSILTFRDPDNIQVELCTPLED